MFAHNHVVIKLLRHTCSVLLIAIYNINTLITWIYRVFSHCTGTVSLKQFFKTVNYNCTPVCYNGAYKDSRIQINLFATTNTFYYGINKQDIKYKLQDIYIIIISN